MSTSSEVLICFFCDVLPVTEKKGRVETNDGVRFSQSSFNGFHGDDRHQVSSRTVTSQQQCFAGPAEFAGILQYPGVGVETFFNGPWKWIFWGQGVIDRYNGNLQAQSPRLQVDLDIREE